MNVYDEPKQILEKEGHDPETFMFAIAETPYKPGPASRKKGTPTSKYTMRFPFTAPLYIQRDICY